MYNASFPEFVVRHKSHVWALRSVYNDAAPIHRRLPPKILLEVFANFRHDGTRHGPPALRVCHYWHTLLQRTPQLWQSLLRQEFLVKQDSQWKARRFAAALSRSAPLDLSLHIRGIDHAVLDVLAPYSCRFASMIFRTQGFSYEVHEPLDRLLRLDMPILRCLDICRWPFSTRITKSSTVFFLFPRLQTLRIADIYTVPPEVQLIPLRHLELANCWESVGPSKVPMSVHTLLAVIRNCPNLETLRVEGSLPLNTRSDSEAPVNISRLRRLTLQETPLESTLTLLSYLVLPLTTALNVKPFLAHEMDPLLLSTSIVTPLGLPPIAEVALHLKSTMAKNDVTWETQGDGSRRSEPAIALPSDPV